MPWYTTVDADVRSSPIVDNRPILALLCRREKASEGDAKEQEAGDRIVVDSAANKLAGSAVSVARRPVLPVRCDAAKNRIFDTLCSFQGCL
jgi:hypothetical protein